MELTEAKQCTFIKCKPAQQTLRVREKFAFNSEKNKNALFLNKLPLEIQPPSILKVPEECSSNNHT